MFHKLFSATNYTPASKLTQGFDVGLLFTSLRGVNLVKLASQIQVWMQLFWYESDMLKMHLSCGQTFGHSLLCAQFHNRDPKMTCAPKSTRSVQLLQQHAEQDDVATKGEAWWKFCWNEQSCQFVAACWEKKGKPLHFYTRAPFFKFP